MLLPLACIILLVVNSVSCVQKHSGSKTISNSQEISNRYESSDGQEISSSQESSDSQEISNGKSISNNQTVSSSQTNSNIQEIRDIKPDRIIYTAVDEQPAFPGGETEKEQFIRNSIRYPASAFFERIQGTVVCSFIVEENGKITNIQIIEGVYSELDNESMRVISLMPRWNPGRLNGVAVPVLCTLSFPFKIQKHPDYP